MKADAMMKRETILGISPGPQVVNPMKRRK
jgi:hypothetical protein